MDPLQSNLSDKDRNKLIETYGGDDKFKNIFKNIFDKGTGKKVENFLQRNKNQVIYLEQAGYKLLIHFQHNKGGTKVAHDYDEDIYKENNYEIINTPGYDPASVLEAQRQLLRMNQQFSKIP